MHFSFIWMKLRSIKEEDFNFLLLLFNLRSDQSWHYSFQLRKKMSKEQAVSFYLQQKSCFEHISITAFHWSKGSCQTSRQVNFWLSKRIFFLFGGWTNPFEKYVRQIGNLPQLLGVNIKKSLKPPPSFSAFCWVNCLMLTLPEKKSLKITPEHWMGKRKYEGGEVFSFWGRRLGLFFRGGTVT